ncbi:MAG: hypothetical protein EBS48_09185 [Actinobacteria bacterium]|nr:hypothetical protein [Actinomycetota bacterium]
MPATRPQFSSTDMPDLNDARALLARVWGHADFRGLQGQVVEQIARVSADGKVCVFVYGEADVIVDVNGWFGSARGFTGMTPVRVSDTRNGLGSVPGK